MKLLLVVIDAASPRVMCPAVQTGRLPVMQRLAAAGSMHQSSVTIFPSITPAATSTIITGTYPREHGIDGAAWFDERSGEVAYYGDDFWVVAREGFGAFVREFLVRLNGDRLKAPTLFELVERGGRQAACLNYLVYRGIHEHHADVPLALASLPGVPLNETVLGPSIFCLGDFVATRERRGRRLDPKGGLLHRFGMDDESSGQLLCQMSEDKALPDFTVAYFADNDFLSHEVGPTAALSTIGRVDRMLGQAFDAAGGMERFLEDICIVITSDHGHCEILADEERAVIRLDRVFQEFRTASLGRSWTGTDELMICPNMRAAQIYVREPTAVLLDRVWRTLLAEPRVDQVIWRTAATRPGATGYTVVSSKGRLEFQRGSGQEHAGCDEYGTLWSWRGDLAVLDLVQDGRDLVPGDYPNALERIAGVLDAPNSGHFWVTAQPGCEFDVPGGKAHVGGGSHGALHALDSLSPVIVAGAGRSLDPRRPFRSVDLAPFCMDVLGMPMRYRVGEART